jgi:hypothetical protein
LVTFGTEPTSVANTLQLVAKRSTSAVVALKTGTVTTHGTLFTATCRVIARVAVTCTRTGAGTVIIAGVASTASCNDFLAVGIHHAVVLHTHRLTLRSIMWIWSRDAIATTMFVGRLFRITFVTQCTDPLLGRGTATRPARRGRFPFRVDGTKTAVFTLALFAVLTAKNTVSVVTHALTVVPNAVVLTRDQNIVHIGDNIFSG